MDIKELREVALSKAKEVDVPQELTEAMQEIDKIVYARLRSNGQDAHELIRQLKIADWCHILEKHHTREEAKYVIAVNTLISEGEGVTASERLADEAFPLAAVTRRKIRSVAKVLDAIRSELSYLKSEHQNIDHNG